MISYYWPPAGGSGVQRWLFMTRELVRMGWSVDVLTVTQTTSTPVDKTLQHYVSKKIKVHRIPVWEPGKCKKYSSERMVTSKRKWSYLVLWIRANLFFPDARMFWIYAALKWLPAYLRKHPKDLIITTGPPHSTHMIGYRCAKKINIKWVADFRDPWSGFFQNKILPMSKRTQKKHLDWEKSIVKNADAVLTTAPQLKDFYACINPHAYLVYNGYEKTLKGSPKDAFQITYTGSLKPNQNPTALWIALQKLTTEDQEMMQQVSLHFYGAIAPEVKKSVLEYGLKNHVNFYEYQPKNYIDKALTDARLLLLMGIDMQDTDNVIHAKIFEYMSAKRPILFIGSSSSDTAQLIREYGLGKIHSFDQVLEIKKTIQYYYRTLKSTFEHENTRDVTYFSREKQASELDLILRKQI